MLSPEEAHHLKRLTDGDRPPESGMERHFLRVIQGEASPLTPKEHEWLAYWETGATSSPRSSEHLSKYDEALALLRARDQLIVSLEGQVQQLTEDLARVTTVLRGREVAFNQQAEEIERLQDWLKRAHAALRKYEPPETRGNTEATAPTDKKWTFCHNCGGDGGPGGRCLRCGGNGFEPT